MNMNLFARLQKFNAATGEFEAVLADETPDLSGEIFDYTKSKPHFIEWSGNISKATDGKSAGNLRAMHGLTVAGKFTSVTCDDAQKAVVVTGEVIDQNERAKFAKGCYSGLSIGGKYISTWDDPKNPALKRYEAKPTEGSLVDYPCNPNTTFKVLSPEGERVQKFATTFDDAESMTKWVASLTGDEKLALAKIAERSDVSPKSGTSKYGNVKFADEKNKKYPIDTAAHIRAAWNYINKPHNASKYDAADLKTIKSHIIAAWKDKIDSAGPPSAAKDKKADKVAKAAEHDAIASVLFGKPGVEKAASALGDMMGLKKGMYSVARLADLLDSLDCLANGTQFEADIEQDGSVIPAELKQIVKDLGEALLHMAAEEVEELTDSEDEITGVFAMSAKAETQKRDDQIAALTAQVTDLTAKLAKAAPGEVSTELQKKADEALAKVAELTKDLVESMELNKAASARIDELTALVTKLNGEPDTSKLPAKTVVVDKSADGGEAGDPPAEDVVKNADGTVNAAATALRKQLKNPVAINGRAVR
jgi:hypothetical protein